MKVKKMKRKDRKHRFVSLRSPAFTEDAVIRGQMRFLEMLWAPRNTTTHTGFGVLCFRTQGNHRFIQEFVRLDKIHKVGKLLNKFGRKESDQFFCPNTFNAKCSKKIHVQNTRLAWCDVDDADPKAFKPHPSIIWQTSPGHYQSIWLWDGELAPHEAEGYSKALTYRHDGDKNGWAINKLLRLPGSINHKPEYSTPFIPILHFNMTPIRKRPKPLSGQTTNSIPEFVALTMNPFKHDRLKVLKKYRRGLRRWTQYLIRHKSVGARDRSECIFAMVADLHKAGADTDEIACVVWGSPYFQDKYGEDINALETEISRIISKLGGRNGQ